MTNLLRYNSITAIPLHQISGNLRIPILKHDRWIFQPLLEEEETLIWIKEQQQIGHWLVKPKKIVEMKNLSLEPN